PGIILLLLVGLLVTWLAVTAPLSKSLQPIAPPGIVLLSADGKPIARRGAVTDQPVNAAKLPKHVPQAFLAVEDRRFYMHLGIDPWGILRAAFRNTLAGGVREGGSTITQQLAKLSFLSSDQTAGRKLREAFIALWLEAWLSKDEILSRYLSNAYFGDNVYGLRAASQHYFSKDPERLSISEAAMLAGLLKAPSRLAPTVNLKGARQRGSLVKAAMVDAGFISEAQTKRLRTVQLKVRRVTAMPTGTYFADWVLPQARELAGGGYGEQTIQTTLDSQIQRQAIRAVNRAKLGNAQVALVAMRPTGEIVAMIGGKDYSRSPFNRATQARRQPGSTFKLFVYLAALRSGLDPDSKVEDRPLTIGDWTPKNNDGVYRGRITLREAFARSSNVAAVRLAERVGREDVIKAARDLGVTSPLGNEPSLALGTSSLTLLELTRAYAAVAHGSYPVTAHGIPKGEGSWFDRIWSGQRRFGGNREEMLRDLLWNVVNRGTGRSAALGIDTFGKTGTTQDNRDAIFVGFAGDLVTAVWVGNDDNTPLKGIQGGGLPARIWRDFMSNALRAKIPLPRPVVRETVEPAEEPGPLSGQVTVPLEGTGYELGVNLGNESITISAAPANPGDDRPPIRGELPIIIPPPAQSTTEPKPPPPAPR
ncbi:MAG TPA: PBP1A family penicillin-binding protein, partial [Allosphingosinicella sp.]|nr:PBP1A family penicillin-binding protein [Allosphingosinicella sp.]